MNCIHSSRDSSSGLALAGNPMDSRYSGIFVLKLLSEEESILRLCWKALCTMGKKCSGAIVGFIARGKRRIAVESTDGFG